ncbi:hypothetical protein HK100_011460 [Physocladia obscura]|uniref:Uncharacterized protein n=1 Tax=Physocladia obscura TaxID=109957 RepID=A0AAD5T9F5_9FUNG|nr:hypothetical protein HK100_011460 [Physocladia obscura]
MDMQCAKRNAIHVYESNDDSVQREPQAERSDLEVFVVGKPTVRLKFNINYDTPDNEPDWETECINSKYELPDKYRLDTITENLITELLLPNQLQQPRRITFSALDSDKNEEIWYSTERSAGAPIKKSLKPFRWLKLDVFNSLSKKQRFSAHKAGINSTDGEEEKSKANNRNSKNRVFFSNLIDSFERRKTFVQRKSWFEQMPSKRRTSDDANPGPTTIQSHSVVRKHRSLADIILRRRQSSRFMGCKSLKDPVLDVQLMVSTTNEAFENSKEKVFQQRNSQHASLDTASLSVRINSIGAATLKSIHMRKSAESAAELGKNNSKELNFNPTVKFLIPSELLNNDHQEISENLSNSLLSSSQEVFLKGVNFARVEDQVSQSTASIASFDAKFFGNFKYAGHSNSIYVIEGDETECVLD